MKTKTDFLIDTNGVEYYCRLGHLCWPGRKKFDGATIAWPVDARASYFNVVDNNRITAQIFYMSPGDMEKLRKTGFVRVESGGLGAWSITAL